MPKNVAVVVVHGVADQQPAESARQIANLLTDLRPRGIYSTFQEEKIRVPVEPVPPAGEKPGGRRRWWSFEERNDDVIRRHRGDSPSVEPDEGFMRDQLRHYDPDGPRVFETVRLDGKHNPSNSRVHVYEAYWADLSRLGTSVFSFFGELYQLLLHLPSLGRNAVDYARAANGNTLPWRAFSWLHRWSLRWLTLFIVVLNLAMATLVLPLLVPRLTRLEVKEDGTTVAMPTGLDSHFYPPVVSNLAHAVLALAAIGVAAWLLHRRQPVRGWLWAVAPVLAAAIGWGVAEAICCGWGAARLLLFEAWALSAFLIALLLASYNRMRPGALLVGGILLAATGLFLLKTIAGALSNEAALSEAVVQVAQVINVGLQILWRIHVPWMLVAILAGVLCAAMARTGWRRQAWNTAWTARATVTLSTALFANLTLAVWAAVFKAVQVIVPKEAPFRPLWFGDTITKVLCLETGGTTIETFLRQTLMVSASRAFILITLVFAVFVLAAVWSILPSVLVESKPRRKQEEKKDQMRALGVWLTRGLNYIPAAAEIFTILFLLTIVILLRSGCAPHAEDETSWKAISAAAALLVALVGARFWLPGARGALDIVLDVDNYLRQHPKTNTPRARIAERCASLLGFILDRKQSGQEYDSVIVIAHSQGTMIVADLLRFLKLQGHPLSGRLKAKNPAFFSMGNPLHQLYARAFAGLYPWVWQQDGPTRDDLAVSEWINAYFSGDYVGRFVWRDKPTPEIWDRRNEGSQCAGEPDVRVVAEGTLQMCLGEGAHTHYWDHHGDEVAWKLDELIVARCGGQA